MIAQFENMGTEKNGSTLRLRERATLRTRLPSLQVDGSTLRLRERATLRTRLPPRPKW